MMSVTWQLSDHPTMICWECIVKGVWCTLFVVLAAASLHYARVRHLGPTHASLLSCAVLALQVVQELSSNVVVIEKLENFQYKDKNGKDFGENVRHRAKQLAELIIDPDRIREERRKVRAWLLVP